VCRCCHTAQACRIHAIISQQAKREHSAFPAIQTLPIGSNHEDLQDLKDKHSRMMESKRFCLLCAGAAPCSISARAARENNTG
jgi:hypothetical protein